MADRQFQQFGMSLEKRLVRLYAVVNVAGAGAVTLQKWVPPAGPGASAAGSYAAAPTGTTFAYASGFRGVESVARTGTGAWTIVLQDPYQRLLGVNWTQVTAAGAATVVAMAVVSGSTNTNVASATTPQIKLLFSSAAATAADPANGDQILLEIMLQDSTAL